MISFIKMQGLGNDFVILDAREVSILLNSEEIRSMADRRLGIGCDQLIIIEPPRKSKATAYLQIYNADGSESEACGNGARCVAAKLMQEMNTVAVTLETAAGILETTATRDGNVSINMGKPQINWDEIPLTKQCDTLHLGIDCGILSDPVAVNIGNPHCVFFVKNINIVDLEELGPVIECASIYRNRTNVEVAQILDKGHIRMRVWERGAGITPACGTGACATVVAAYRRKLANREVEVIVDGGTLLVEWLSTGDVLMTGPTEVSFTGQWKITAGA